MLRRRPKDPTPPERPAPAWQRRVDAAKAMIRANRPPVWLDDRLADVERGLHAAEADRERLAGAISQLDPERTASELKDALRAERRRPGSVGDDRIALLRRRYDTVHQLLDRRAGLDQRIDSALVDLELLAVRTVEAAATAGGFDQLDDPLERLRIDLLALEQAHAELDHL